MIEAWSALYVKMLTHPKDTGASRQEFNQFLTQLVILFHLSKGILPAKDREEILDYLGTGATDRIKGMEFGIRIQGFLEERGIIPLFAHVPEPAFILEATRGGK